MERLKKIGLVLLFIAATLGIGYLLFRLFIASPTVPTPPPEEGVTPTEPTSGLPSAGEWVPGVGFVPNEGLPSEVLTPAAPSEIASGGVTKTLTLENVPTVSPVLSPTGSLSYLNSNDGRFYTLGLDGEPRMLSNKQFYGAEDVTWSPGTEKAIIEFPDGSKVVYDFEAETQVTLPSHWEDFSFSDDGEMFAAKTLGLDPDNQWLIAVNADGSDARLIEHLGDNADKVTVSVSPDSTVLALSETGDPIGFDTREIIFIGQQNENFKALRIEGFNFEPVWSPSGESMLYSASAAGSDYKPTLWFVSAKDDTIGQSRTNIGLNTWAGKCTFSDAATVYCAVPDSLPDGIGLQPDLPVNAADAIYKVDLNTGRTTLVGRPEGAVSIAKLVISKDQGTLYMQDAFSGSLSSMKLK